MPLISAQMRKIGELTAPFIAENLICKSRKFILIFENEKWQKCIHQHETAVHRAEAVKLIKILILQYFQWWNEINGKMRNFFCRFGHDDDDNLALCIFSIFYYNLDATVIEFHSPFFYRFRFLSDLCAAK